MKRSSLLLLALVFVVGIVGSALAAGTDNNINWKGEPMDTRLRVGIVAYCADMYHNAGDTGLQSNKINVKEAGGKDSLLFTFNGVGLGAPPFFQGDPNGPKSMWLLDGPFSNLGTYGAQNLVDYLSYDDGIDRVRDLTLIDGDLVNPTSTQLIQNFDIVIAYTDNKCGPTLPNAVLTSATTALSGFIGTAGKKLVLTGFAFSSDLGFGNQLYVNGQSPLTKGGPGNSALCNRDPGSDPGCIVGTCPSATCTNVPTANGPECLDNVTGGVCTVYVPNDGLVLGTNNATDQACREFLNAVNGPTSSSWATALTAANVGRGASLCMNYQDNKVDGVDSGIPFLAINAARNIVAVNAFPPDAVDIQKFWYGCILGDVVQYLSGEINRCPGGIFCNH